MFGKSMRIGAAVALGAGMFVVLPAQSASAADGCGSDYFKESFGYLTADGPWQGAGGRNAWIYHAGKVVFCTQDDTWNDDENRRAVIGYPQSTYSFQSQVLKNGSYASFCVKQTIRAHMTGIKTSEAWDLGGSVSKDGPGVSASWSATYDTVTVSIAKTKVCGASARQIIAETSGIVVTASDESGKVEWVELTTQITGQYTVNGIKYGINHSLQEKDYSART